MVKVFCSVMLLVIKGYQSFFSTEASLPAASDQGTSLDWLTFLKAQWVVRHSLREGKPDAVAPPKHPIPDPYYQDLDDEIEWTLYDSRHDPILAGSLNICTEYGQSRTHCFSAKKWFLSAAVDLVLLTIRCAFSVTEKASNIAVVAESEGTTPESENCTKDFAGCVKIHEDAVYTASEIGVSISNVYW